MLAAEKTRKPAKMHRLVARVSDEDRGIIAQAAAITGQTVSGFVLAQARKAAMKTFETHARNLYSSANVPDDLSLLASGVTPAREAEAGGMTEVPQA